MSVNVQTMSDLHLEFHRDNGDSFIRSLNSDDVDVLVLAGDINTITGLKESLIKFCSKYPNVVFVLGNHEYYGTWREQVILVCEEVKRKHSNFYWLENNSCIIKGQRFIGCTLWFKDTPTNYSYQHSMNDFRVIKGFNTWNYKANEYSVSYLYKHVQPTDVVVTHHAPSYVSVIDQYKGSALNRFFVCDMEVLIQASQPKLWIHGHVHNSLNYKLGTTRVICNPFGYVGQELNPSFNDNFRIVV